MSSGSQADPASRPLRADAQRNAARIVSVARAAFDEVGPDVSLDTIALRANVGPGTLYRRFPTRDHLVEAVYRPDLRALAHSARDYLVRLDGSEGFERWIRDEYVPMQDQPAIGVVLQNALASAPDLFAEDKDELMAAVQELFEAGVASGVIRRDVEARDVLRLAYGIVVASRDDDSARRRMLSVMFDGLREDG